MGMTSDFCGESVNITYKENIGELTEGSGSELTKD